MLAISDIRLWHLLFQYRNKICQTKSSHSHIDISFLSHIRLNQYRIFWYLKLINHSQLNREKFCQKIILSHLIPTHILYVCNQASYHCAMRIYKYWCRISDIGQKFIPISDIMSDSKHFSPISDVPISGSVWYRWSRISNWVPTYGHLLDEKIFWEKKSQYLRIFCCVWGDADEFSLLLD